MKKALEYIVASIVERTDSVIIEESEEEGTTIFTIQVDPEEIGKVIGKDGKVIRAIRNVMKIAAMKENKRIHISIAE